MLILITKDGATVVPKEVATLDDAKAFAEAGFEVHLQDGESKIPLAEAMAAQAPAAVDTPAAE